MIDRFNIRVYGLLLEGGRVLVSDEVIRGVHITKFPGGGMEFGEGPEDCLVREVAEEMGLAATGLRHYYTTGHFQRSAYRDQDQLISIYYTFEVDGMHGLPYGTEPFGPVEPGKEWFRWLMLDGATAEAATLPIDRLVLGRLVQDHQAGGCRTSGA